MGTSFLRSDSDKLGQGLKWGQSDVPPGEGIILCKFLTKIEHNERIS